MAEVGLVLFAKTALDVMREVVPDYSGKFSKHTFTQPQLMTILCLVVLQIIFCLQLVVAKNKLPPQYLV